MTVDEILRAGFDAGLRAAQAVSERSERDSHLIGHPICPQALEYRAERDLARAIIEEAWLALGLPAQEAKEQEAWLALGLPAQEAKERSICVPGSLCVPGLSLRSAIADAGRGAR